MQGKHARAAGRMRPLRFIGHILPHRKSVRATGKFKGHMCLHQAVLLRWVLQGRPRRVMVSTQASEERV